MEFEFAMSLSHTRSMSNQVLLTGATGLLGSHLLEQGLSLGYTFYVLTRDISARTYLHSVKDNSAQIKIISADLLSIETASLPKNIDIVIHSAALASSRSEDAKLMQDINVTATKNLYNHYRDQNIKWIQISSVSTLCNGKSDWVDESFQGQCRDTAYAKSKLEADQWLESQSNNILYIHPCYMLDSWDSKPSSGVVLYALKFNKITKYQNKTKNFVAARDVAKGVFQAIEKNVQGHYLLGHHNIKIEEFLKIASQDLGVPYTAQITDEDLDDPFAKEFCAASSVDISKASRDFGYNPTTPLATSVKNAVDYFSKMRMLRRASS